MAHFWGRIRGRFGRKVTNIGSSASGIRAVVNGFNFGVIVDLSNKGKEDKAEIFLTNGSNAEIEPVLIGTFSEANLKKPKKNPKQTKAPIKRQKIGGK